jgi:hypothetical protein
VRWLALWHRGSVIEERDGWRGALVWCVLGVMLAGSLTACSASLGRSDRCWNDLGDVPARPDPPVATADLPAPVAEAAWTINREGRLTAFDGRNNSVAGVVDAGVPQEFGIRRVLSGAGIIWIYGLDGTVVLVDPAAATVRGRATVPPATPFADNLLYVAHGVLWIAQPGRLWRVDASGAKSSMPLPSGFAAQAVTASDRWLWLAGGRQLVRVDPAAGTVAPAVDVPLPAGIGTMLSTGRGLVVSAHNQPELWILDPQTGTVRSSVRIPDGELIFPFFEIGTDVWGVGNCGHALRLSGPELREIHRLVIADVSQDHQAAFAAGSLWIADPTRDELVRIDPPSARVVARIPVRGADPDNTGFSFLAGAHSIWVLGDGMQRVDPATNRVLRVGPPTETSEVTSAVTAAPPS